MSILFNPQLDSPADNLPTILPLYGGAEKPISRMTDEELADVSDTVMAKVREQAFSRGRPIIREENGRVVQEYADGHIEITNE